MTDSLKKKIRINPTSLGGPSLSYAGCKILGMCMGTFILVQDGLINRLSEAVWSVVQTIWLVVLGLGLNLAELDKNRMEHCCFKLKRT